MSRLRLNRVPVAAALLALGWCAASASAQLVVYSSSFEGTDGGWVGTNDWERGMPDGTPGMDTPSTSPVGGNTGMECWATNLTSDYTPSTTSDLSQTFDFTGLTGITLEFFNWVDTGSNSFDIAEVIVDDGVTQTQVFLSDGGPSTMWDLVSVDLSAYDNMANITIIFRLSTTGVVHRTGWFIDDVSITSDVNPADMTDVGVAIADTGIQSIASTVVVDVTLTNTGPDPTAAGVEVTIPLPTGVGYDMASSVVPSGSVAVDAMSGNLIWSGVSVENGMPVTASLALTSTQAAQYTLTASITSIATTDGNAANDSATDSSVIFTFEEDYNLNGVIDQADVLIFGEDFGKSL